MDLHIPAYLTKYAIVAPAATDLVRMDTTAARLIGMVAKRVPDGVRLAAELRAALPALPSSPAISSPDDTVMLGVAKNFLAWYDTLFDEPGPMAVGTTAENTTP